MSKQFASLYIKGRRVPPPSNPKPTMSQVRFLMIGGFLGAGKTTAVARLARHYISQGLQVGLVTNDQAYDLVDTESLRGQGFRVGEVPGACFCCKFNELLETLAQLADDQQPDILISEPVGSCTDLVATVIEPLQQLHGDRYEIAPLTVFFKPEHGQKILAAGKTGFSPKAAYIFLKQLEEAEVIVINKIDKLQSHEVDNLAEAVRIRFPNKVILAASAKEGEGFSEVIQAIDGPRPSLTHRLEIDYDQYAEGEAELGWVNCRAELTSHGHPYQLDAVVLALADRLAEALFEATFEPAHLKVLGQTAGTTSIANLVSSNLPAELSVTTGATAITADFLINARVAGDPEQLAAMVRHQVQQLATDFKLSATLGHMQQFRPARPEPTHRIKADGQLAS